MSRYKGFLIATFAGVWLWAAFRPVYPHDWLLENYLVFVFVPIVLLTGRYFQLSDVSYTLITVFLCLHVVGSHYTYSEVPFGSTLQRWLGASRNQYDRLVHLAFGLLFAYPLREVFLRVADVKGFWGYYLPLDVTLSFSALYEIVEWLTAATVDAAAGIAFLGAQGDVWDAQKDMALAAGGAFLTMVVTALVNWRYDPGFARELRASFEVSRRDRPLGEEQLRRWRRRRRTTRG
jgi:putative membrane protein